LRCVRDRAAPLRAAFFVRCVRYVLIWNIPTILPPELPRLGTVCAVLPAELQNTS
jgi:hypothetical protein